MVQPDLSVGKKWKHAITYTATA